MPDKLWTSRYLKKCHEHLSSTESSVFILSFSYSFYKYSLGQSFSVQIDCQITDGNVGYFVVIHLNQQYTPWRSVGQLPGRFLLVAKGDRITKEERSACMCHLWRHSQSNHSRFSSNTHEEKSVPTGCFTITDDN